MKKLILFLLLAIPVSHYSQDKRETNQPKREQFTPEQRKQLMLKKMTLELDLNAKQQDQLGPILAEQIQKREQEKGQAKKQNLSNDELFAKKMNGLDERIAFRDKLKTILSADQMKKWESMKDDNQKRMHRQLKQRKQQKEEIRK